MTTLQVAVKAPPTPARFATPSDAVARLEMATHEELTGRPASQIAAVLPGERCIACPPGDRPIAYGLVMARIDIMNPSVHTSRKESPTKAWNFGLEGPRQADSFVSISSPKRQQHALARETARQAEQLAVLRRAASWLNR